MLKKSILSVLILISLVNICVGKVKKCYFGVAKIVDGEKTYISGPIIQTCDEGSNSGCYHASADGIVHTFGCASENDCKQLHVVENDELGCCDKNECYKPSNNDKQQVSFLIICNLI